MAIQGLVEISKMTFQYHTDDARCVQLYDTVIFKQYRDGTIELNSGGFYTATTSKKINQQLPAGFKLFSKKGSWVLETPTGDLLPFVDGMKFNPSAMLQEKG